LAAVATLAVCAIAGETNAAMAAMTATKTTRQKAWTLLRFMNFPLGNDPLLTLKDSNNRPDCPKRTARAILD
jgi:hypothetical protein